MPRQPSSLDMLMTTMDILKSGRRNTSKQQVGWRLSYLPYAQDTDSDETAVVLGQNDCFLILYGDHFKALDGLTRDQAVAYWQARPELWGATSGRIGE